jgi:hypothetical protein
MRATSTVKKTYNLPPRLVKQVQQIFGVKTETEAIVRSLKEVAFMADVERAIYATSAKLPKFRRFR